MNAPVRLQGETRGPDPVLLNDWHAVAFSSEVTAGNIVPATLLGEDLIVWRDASGNAHVWKDLCIHRGSRLSKGWIRNDTVVCPYHGWRYDGTAQCVLIPSAPDQPIPSKARAFPHACVERYGMVWACLGTPANDPPPFPAWDDPAYRNFNTGPYVFRSSGFRSVENFLDATHFPFVHSGMNGDIDRPDVIPDYKVMKGENGLRTSEIDVYQPYGDHRKIPVMAGYTYNCVRPLSAYIDKRVTIVDPDKKHLGSPNDQLCIFLNAQPVDEVNTIIRLAVSMNFGPELTEADVRERQDAVFEQDRVIVETQRPERIPIELREEMHHRTDKLGVAYRRWLSSLGIHYGAI